MSGVAHAVVHFDPPQVFMAENLDVLQRVLAVELIARTPPGALSDEGAAELRQALLDERWGDAMTSWIRLRQVPVDVYTYTHVYDEEELPEDLVGVQLQFTPLFRA